MSFPKNVEDQALAACARRCCICQKFCGRKMELHHIKQRTYDGEDSFENCIPLCFDCHADMGKADPKHPKGKHYSENELRLHRDNWYAKVASGLAFASEDISVADKELFQAICSAFNDTAQRWMRDEDLSGIHPMRCFEALEELLFKAKDPAFEFLNSELEYHRQLLFEAMDEFLYFLHMHTFRIGSDMPEYYATHQWLADHGYIPSNPNVDMEEFAHRYETQFVGYAQKINELKNTVWDKYCEFVRHGRRLMR